jgi:hypothetical protein
LRERSLDRLAPCIEARSLDRLPAGQCEDSGTTGESGGNPFEQTPPAREPRVALPVRQQVETAEPPSCEALAT